MLHKKEITTGVGQFPAKTGTLYRHGEVLAFLEKHCTHPELFQDIKLLFAGVPINEGRYVVKPEEMLQILQLNPIFMTLVIRRIRYGSWAVPMSSIYLSVNKDGLITDIRDKPFSNPVNYHHIAISKEV